MQRNRTHPKESHCMDFEYLGSELQKEAIRIQASGVVLLQTP